MKKKKIIVVMGGISKEREISLKTGNSCIKAIKKIGYQVIKFDPKFSSIFNLKKIDANIIFNALHGKNGEDGKIQSFFEFFKKKYTHSGVLSSIIAMNKHFSKLLFLKNNIRTPKYLFLEKDNLNVLYLKKQISKNKVKFPIVIKPNDEGSSIGVKICNNIKILEKEFNTLKKKHKSFII